MKAGLVGVVLPDLGGKRSGIQTSSHVTLVTNDDNVVRLDQESENKIKQLENIIAKIKVDKENKIQYLCDEVKILKECSDKIKNEVRKELDNMKKKLENAFDEKIKFIKDKCDSQSREIEKLKEENDKINNLVNRKFR